MITKNNGNFEEHKNDTIVLYAVKDEKANMFTNVRTALNDEMMERQLCIELSQQQNGIIVRCPGDFSLYRISDMNVFTGCVSEMRPARLKSIKEIIEDGQKPL